MKIAVEIFFGATFRDELKGGDEISKNGVLIVGFSRVRSNLTGVATEIPNGGAGIFLL